MVLVKLDIVKKTVIIQQNVQKIKKDLSSFTSTLIEKISCPSKTKGYYQSHLKKKKPKQFQKQSKIIAQQPKNIENRSTGDIKSSIIKHPKATYKLSKTTNKLKSFPNRWCW